MAGTHPELETERLTLRPHRVEDFDEYAALWADPDVVRYIGGTPSSREASWARLLRQAGHWDLLGFGYWILRDKTSGRLVGEAGLANFRRDIDPPLGADPEAGWVLATWAHGAGRATEAMRRILAWSDEHLGARVQCIIDESHAASVRVAEKTGFSETCRATYMGDPILVLARPAPR